MHSHHRLKFTVVPTSPVDRGEKVVHVVDEPNFELTKFKLVLLKSNQQKRLNNHVALYRNHPMAQEDS